MNAPLKRTPLYDLHLSLGAKMVEFAGYQMPVQYPDGVLKEHLWTREKAGLFDVSHMGQAFLTTTEIPRGSDDAHLKIAAALETLVPGEVKKLKKGGLRYSVFLNEKGGILDDLMITRPLSDDEQGSLFLVVNASMKEQDFTLLRSKLKGRAELAVAERRALIALQGPSAAAVLEEVAPGVRAQPFMTMRVYAWRGQDLFISRSGYTGEDGFEISIPGEKADEFAQVLLSNADVKPIGLGARDSLRLEAGLCLYGHDLNEEISPVEGNIAFAIGKRRREEGGFPGAGRILTELGGGPKKLRVGIKPVGRAPAREGAEIQSADGEIVGVVTSGGFGPTVNAPVAMGYVDAAFASTGGKLNLIVRGKPLPAVVADLPFTPHRYHRG